MTFSVIQAKVMDRLNLSSATATARVADSINERYRMLASSIGMDTVERVNGITANTVIGNRNVTFTCEKILTVYNALYTPVIVLDEVSVDYLRNAVVGIDPPESYAVSVSGASTVTIYLDCIPATIYALTADALVNLSTLSGSMIPAFAEDYHDLLVLGAMATEYDKMEKTPLADKKEKQYEDRLSQLRMYIAKSAYKDIVQGGGQTNRWMR